MDDFHDLHQDVLLDLQEGVPCRRLDIGIDLDIEGKGTQFDQADTQRFPGNHLVTFQESPNAVDHLPELCFAGFVAQGNAVFQVELVPAAVVDDLAFCQVRVRHRDDRPVEGPDSR